MPRYFFHLESGEINVRDTKGREFGCIEEALFHAQMLIRKADINLAEKDENRWIFRIQNAQDDTEMVVLFPFPQRHSPRPSQTSMGIPAT